eukprot:scaffold269489_cov24-Tisochrysis_lutea.AAC.3
MRPRGTQAVLVHVTYIKVDGPTPEAQPVLGGLHLHERRVVLFQHALREAVCARRAQRWRPQGAGDRVVELRATVHPARRCIDYDELRCLAALELG